MATVSRNIGTSVIFYQHLLLLVAVTETFVLKPKSGSSCFNVSGDVGRRDRESAGEGQTEPDRLPTAGYMPDNYSSGVSREGGRLPN